MLSTGDVYPAYSGYSYLSYMTLTLSFKKKKIAHISLTVPTNLKHDKFAAGIRALFKGGNDPFILQQL